MSTIPNEQQCIDILKDHGAPDRLIKHVCTVTALAVAVARRCGADQDLIIAGGLLHDLGRTRTHGVRHGLEGEALARSLGLPEPLVLIIRRHIGSGILPKEARTLGLPDLDYVPRTLEEKIVCHADNLVSDADYLTSDAAYRDFLRKGLTGPADRMLEMHKELSERCGADIDSIADEIRGAEPRGPCGRYLKMHISSWSGPSGDQVRRS
ncbi:MAG: HDIG domain-containing protein [Methanomassiliicoccus sp.]|nr:HDIG domain-containing protein [Methanomassiliicoccus sp.]